MPRASASGMAHGAGGVQINRVKVVEVIAARVELFQLFAVALRQNDVTQVATGGNHLLSVIRHMIYGPVRLAKKMAKGTCGKERRMNERVITLLTP